MERNTTTTLVCNGQLRGDYQYFALDPCFSAFARRSGCLNGRNEVCLPPRRRLNACFERSYDRPRFGDILIKRVLGLAVYHSIWITSVPVRYRTAGPVALLQSTRLEDSQRLL